MYNRMLSNRADLTYHNLNRRVRNDIWQDLTVACTFEALFMLRELLSMTLDTFSINFCTRFSHFVSSFDYF